MLPVEYDSTNHRWDITPDYFQWYNGRHTQHFTRATLASAVLAVERWLAGWLVVTRRYCVKTAKPILKLLRPSGSLIILVFGPLRRYPIPSRTHSARAINTRGLENLAIFDWNRRLSRKRCEIGRWLPIEWYNFRWPWMARNPGFKVTV